jgi:hypothetical protein
LEIEGMGLKFAQLLEVEKNRRGYGGVGLVSNRVRRVLAL